MAVCDLCNTPISSASKRYSAAQVRAAVNAGLLPSGSAAELAKVFDPSLQGWKQMVLSDSTDWVLCPSCSVLADARLGKPQASAQCALWRGTVFCVKNENAGEMEYLELPSSLPQGTKYWTYDVTGPAPYPIESGLLQDPKAKTDALRARGYTFKNTTPLGGHIVGVSSAGRMSMSDLIAWSKQQQQPHSGARQTAQRPLTPAEVMALPLRASPRPGDTARQIYRLALPFSIVSIFLVMPVAQIFVALTALVLAAYALRKAESIGKSKSIPIAALFCGAAGLVISILILYNLEDFQSRLKPKTSSAPSTSFSLQRMEAERIGTINVASVEPSFFRGVMRDPQIGRRFTYEEHRSNARVVILSHSCWSSSFASDRAVLGRSVRLNGAAHVIVGVMPREINDPSGVGAWVPRAAKENELATSALRKMLIESKLRIRNLGVSVDSDRVATITGSVSDQAVHKSVEETTRNFPGITNVNNQLVIK